MCKIISVIYIADLKAFHGTFQVFNSDHLFYVFTIVCPPPVLPVNFTGEKLRNDCQHLCYL